MLMTTWRWGALALGGLLTCAVGAPAGDGTYRLDSNAPADAPKFSLGGVGTFSHADRAKPTDDDEEDVVFRGYARGYSRGFYGGGYYGYRLPAFRAGFYAGAYGYGYRPWYGYGFGYRPWYGYGYWPRYYYGFYGPRYYYPYYASYSAPLYDSSPVVSCYEPVVSGVTYSTPSVRMPMPSAVEPPRTTKPAQPNLPYPYDGPPAKQTSKPSYRYDGGPTAPVPMSPAEPSSNGGGRIVKASATKKIAYPAYGDDRTNTPNDDVYTVKNTKK